MRYLYLLFVCTFCVVSAQRVLPLDTLKLREVKDLLADDYGNLYIYKNKDFSFTKYDSLGKQIGKLMMTVPFRIQTVQNPLSVPMFSENAQEMKFVDQNLNEIQRIDFKQKFGFIKIAYAEDLQQIWLLDDSMKRLVQYNFRSDTTINSYPFDGGFDDLLDLLVYENKVYILTRKYIRVYSLKFEKIFEAEVLNGRRFRRENDHVLVITKNAILKYLPEKEIVKVFEDTDAQIVDKNTLSYFEIKFNKLYLYSLEDGRKIKPKAEAESIKKTIEDPDKKEKDKEASEKSENFDMLKLFEEIGEIQKLGI